MDLAGLLLRMVLALGAVLLVMWGFSRLGSRGRRGGGSRARIELLARRSLARGSAVSVLRVGDRVLVVGSTPHSMSVLAEMTPEEAAAGGEPSPGEATPLLPGTGMFSAFGGSGPGSARMADLVERLRERTVRRP